MVFDPFDRTPDEVRRESAPAATIVVDRDSVRNPMKQGDYRRLMTSRPRG